MSPLKGSFRRQHDSTRRAEWSSIARWCHNIHENYQQTTNVLKMQNIRCVLVLWLDSLRAYVFTTAEIFFPLETLQRLTTISQPIIIHCLKTGNPPKLALKLHIFCWFEEISVAHFTTCDKNCIVCSIFPPFVHGIFTSTSRLILTEHNNIVIKRVQCLLVLEIRGIICYCHQWTAN